MDDVQTGVGQSEQAAAPAESSSVDPGELALLRKRSADLAELESRVRALKPLAQGLRAKSTAAIQAASALTQFSPDEERSRMDRRLAPLRDALAALDSDIAQLAG